MWIAHQRFPTKGRVWHPAGAHPFTGINIALVHNGDFANYHSVSRAPAAEEHLSAVPDGHRGVGAALRSSEPGPIIIPWNTSSRRWPRLRSWISTGCPENKKKLYRAIQATHIHGSPDGPWFFIIARNDAAQKQFQLLGITDTAMLRPQVFAFCDGEVQVGLIASEKQAIDATLLSLSKDDIRICPVADKYWNARGGSHTDGGAFIFNLTGESGRLRMSCTDKFGKPVSMPEGSEPCDFASESYLAA